MRKAFLSAAALLVVGLTALPALGATIQGQAWDDYGAPVQGVKIDAIDPSTGKIVGSGLTNANGEYTIEGLDNGNYSVVLNPLNTAFRPGAIEIQLGTAGLSVNWTLSVTMAAVPRGAVGAGIFGSGGLFGSSAATLAAAAAGVGVTGAVGGLAAGGLFGGGGGAKKVVSGSM